jgi:hypothetical protein
MYLVDSKSVLTIFASGNSASTSPVRAAHTLDTQPRNRIRKTCLLFGAVDRGYGLELLQCSCRTELAKRGGFFFGATVLVRSVWCLCYAQ